MLSYYLATLPPYFVTTLLSYGLTFVLSDYVFYLTIGLSYYQAALFRSTLVTAVDESCRLLRWPPGDVEPTNAAAAAAAAAAPSGPPSGTRPTEGGRAGGTGAGGAGGAGGVGGAGGTGGAGGAGEWAGRGAVPCDCPYAPLQACMLWG